MKPTPPDFALQSLGELGSDRSAGLSSGRHPPGKLTIADDDDHHHRSCRASRRLSHFTCFFCKASVTDNVSLHTFGPTASMHIAQFVCTAAAQKLAMWNFPLLLPQSLHLFGQTLVAGCVEIHIYTYMKAHFNVIQNKLAKLGDAIATSNLKLWITHSLTHSLTDRGNC